MSPQPLGSTESRGCCAGILPHNYTPNTAVTRCNINFNVQDQYPPFFFFTCLKTIRRGRNAWLWLVDDRTAYRNYKEEEEEQTPRHCCGNGARLFLDDVVWSSSTSKKGIIQQCHFEPLSSQPWLCKLKERMPAKLVHMLAHIPKKGWTPSTAWDLAYK